MTAYAETQNGSKVIASDRSNYWRYYGLHRDPFLPIVEDNNFYLSVNWEQYSDLLQYLCESNNVLLSVVGVKGAGKTTFTRQFIAQMSDSLKVCRLVGSAALTPEQLSKTLVKDFNLAKPVGETSEEQWEALCQNIQVGNQSCLLVIDDAHRLPLETLRTLMNLIRQQSEHQMRLHILLIGELQLTTMLNSLKVEESDRDILHNITLESLNSQDTEAYVKHRLVAAGLPGALPLRAIDTNRIFKLSEGVPGRINAVARQVLIDVMQQRQLYSFSHFIRTRHTQLLGGTIILLVLLVLAFTLTRGTFDPAFNLFRLLIEQKTGTVGVTTSSMTSTNSKMDRGLEANENQNSAMTRNDKIMVMPTAILGKPEASTLSSNSSNGTLQKTSISAKDEPIITAHNSSRTVHGIISASTASMPTAGAASIQASSTTHPNQWYTSDMVEFKTPARTQAQPTIMPVAASTHMIERDVSSAQNNLPATLASETSSVAMQTSIPTTTNRLLLPNAPVLSNPKHFTLQLVGAGNEAAVNQFIDKHQLDNNTYYYHTNFREKNWYVVIYGNFSTRQAAENALNSLPAAVQQMHPWPRSMESVLTSMSHGEKSASAIMQTASAASNKTLSQGSTIQKSANGEVIIPAAIE